jgi:hypothetical protein
MTFLYQEGECVVVSDVPPREMRKTHPKREFLTQKHQVQDMLTYVKNMKCCVIMEVKHTHFGHTPEGRERIREAKRGEKNPNSKGLSDSHKQKIARAMRVRRGEHHHFYNMKHSSRSKLKISWGMRKLPKRRWAIDDAGNEHFIFAHMELPPGWTWGRKRGAGRRG